MREGIGVSVRESWVRTPVGRRGGVEDVRWGLLVLELMLEMEMESCSMRAAMADVGALEGAGIEGRGAAGSRWMSLSEEDPSLAGLIFPSNVGVAVSRASKPVAVGWMRTLNSGVLGN